MPEKVGIPVYKYYSKLIYINAMDKIFEECEGEYDEEDQDRLTKKLMINIIQLTNKFSFSPYVIKMQGLLYREEWYNEAFNVNEYDAEQWAAERCIEAMFFGSDDEYFYSDEDMEFIADRWHPIWYVPIATRKLDFVNKYGKGSCNIAEEMLKKCNLEYDSTKGIVFKVGDKRDDFDTKGLLYLRQVSDIAGLVDKYATGSKIYDVQKRDCIEGADGKWIIDESRLENSSRELVCKAYLYVYRVYMETRSLELDYEDLCRAVEYFELAKKVDDDFYKYNKSYIELNYAMYKRRVAIYKKFIEMKNEGIIVEEEPELLNFIITEYCTKYWNLIYGFTSSITPPIIKATIHTI